jgi:hypothetical protein
MPDEDPNPDQPTTIRLPVALLKRADVLTERARQSRSAEMFGKVRRPDILRLALRLGLDELERRDLAGFGDDLHAGEEEG